MDDRPQLLSRPIRAFLKLAEILSFAEAAKVLGITQPALTLQIQKLESEVGSELFERRGRSTVRLTPAGRQLQAYASRAEQELEAASQAIDEVRGLKRGVLRVGYPEGHVDLVSTVISRLLQDGPGLTMELTETAAARVQELVLEGRLDVGLAYEWTASDQLEATIAAESPLALVVPERHPFARRQDVPDLVLLSGQAFVLPQKELALRQTIDAYMAKHRFQPRTVVEADKTEMIFSLVRRECGVTIFPVTSVTDLTGLKTVALPRSEVQRTAIIARKELKHPAAKAFVDTVMATLHSGSKTGDRAKRAKADA